MYIKYFVILFITRELLTSMAFLILDFLLESVELSMMFESFINYMSKSKCIIKIMSSSDSMQVDITPVTLKKKEHHF